MYAVWLTSFPEGEKHTLERVVKKQRRSASQKEVSAFLDGISAGTPALVRSFVLDEFAENLVKEFAIHGASAEVRDGQ